MPFQSLKKKHSSSYLKTHLHRASFPSILSYSCHRPSSEDVQYTIFFRNQRKHKTSVHNMDAKYSIVNMLTLVFFALFIALTAAQNLKVLKECADENLKALNNYRASMGLNSLSMNSEARRRAEEHTKSMASANYLEHSSSDVYMDAENVAQK